MAGTKRTAGQSSKIGEQLTFDLVSEVKRTCSVCYKWIVLARDKGDGWIESEFMDLEGRCWDCNSKVARRTARSSKPAGSNPAPSQ